MNFEDFKKDIEYKLKLLTKFKLIHYCYEPASFGSGLLLYKTHNHKHKFIFDGKENHLIWLIKKQSFYDLIFSNCNEVLFKKGLDISLNEVKAIL